MLPTYILSVDSLIPQAIRPAIKHSAHLSRRGCSDASDSFARFAYTTLSNALINNETVLPDHLALDDFLSCKYLPELQQVLFSTDELDESVTYETFVVVPDSIRTLVHGLYGDGVDVNGPFVSVINVASFYLQVDATHHPPLLLVNSC